jgi:hypothetical protein
MKNISFMLCFLFSCSVSANELQPDILVKETIRLLTMGQTTEAFEYAIKDNKIFDDYKKSVNETKLEFENYIKTVGVPIACEKLASKTLIKRYRKDSYLCLSERQPFEIHFRFYRQKDSWKLQSFSYSSDVDELIDNLVLDQITTGK